MPWFIMDYERDTGHLSLEEDCCYRRLIDALWKRDTKPLPLDEVVLARLIRLDMETWTRVRPAMIPFFTITPEGWTNKKVSQIWLWVIAKMQADQERGEKATRARMKQRDEQRDVDNSNPNPHSHSKEQLEAKGKSKAFLNEGNVVRNALELPDEEELLRRTRDVVGDDEMKGRKFGYWRTLIRDHPRAYRDALTDAESRKKEAQRGLPEAQIKKTWAHYMTYQFKEMKKAYGS